jgi:hypothetical protein
MISVPENLPDDPELLKQMLAKMQSRVGFLEEENALLRQRLFGRKSEQTADPATPQWSVSLDASSQSGCQKMAIARSMKPGWMCSVM